MTVLAVLSSEMCSRYASALQSQFDIQIATNSTTALQLARNIQPRLILISCALDDIQGLFIAHAIKLHPGISTDHIIFWGTPKDTKEALALYNSGAFDIINSDVSIDEVTAKLSKLLQHVEHTHKAHQQFNYAYQVAETAMANASELGILLEHTRLIAKSIQTPSLIKNILSACQGFSLNAAIQVRTSEGTYTQSNSGNPSKLENQLLNIAPEQSKVLSIEARLLLSSPNVSILIRNMPADQAKCGRLRDHLHMLLRTAENRIEDLEVFIKSKRLKQHALKDVINNTEQELKQVGSLFHCFHSESENLMNELLVNLESELLGLSLSQSEEALVLEAVQRSRSQLTELFDSGDDINQSLRRVLCQLNQLSA